MYQDPTYTIHLTEWERNYLRNLLIEEQGRTSAIGREVVDPLLEKVVEAVEELTT